MNERRGKMDGDYERGYKETIWGHGTVDSVKDITRGEGEM